MMGIRMPETCGGSSVVGHGQQHHESSGSIPYKPAQPDRPQPTALLPPRSYGKPEAAAAVDRLLTMVTRMPETC